jgi:hypothetical protein
MRRRDGGAVVPANLEELQAQATATWRELVDAAYGLANAVNAGKAQADVRAAEHTLGQAARAYAVAATALLHTRPSPTPRRLRRR